MPMQAFKSMIALARGFKSPYQKIGVPSRPLCHDQRPAPSTTANVYSAAQDSQSRKGNTTQVLDLGNTQVLCSCE